jgi:HEAT repeat protein
MAKDHDFKRLVRARMQDTGERYTEARTALVARRDAGDRVVSDRTRSLLGQLADTGLAAVSRDHLARLPEPERRAAAIEGLRHESWRVRRTCAQLLDRVDLTPESVAALTRALDDEHPQVRRKAIHTLTCENCKPNGCAADVRPAFERAIRDPSSLVRSMVVHVCTLHFFDRQWAIDLVAAVATSDKSLKLRESAAAEIRRLRKRWESDDRRRELEPDIVARTERHGGRWIVIREGRVVATPGKAGRVFRRELSAGGHRYWVAPPGTMRPRIP